MAIAVVVAPVGTRAGELPTADTPTAETLWDRARVTSAARVAHLPPYVAYTLNGNFDRKGKPHAFHYRYVLRTRDGKQFETQLPDSPRDRVDARPQVDDSALYLSPFTVFDLRPHKPGERASAFEPQSSPEPVPEPSAGTMQVIGHVATVSRAYDLSLAGRETLDGTPVWHLHAEPRFDPRHHPIRELYTRVADDEPVRIVIQANASAGPVHSRPSVVFDYHQVDGTWLVSRASMDISLRMLFLSVGGTLGATLVDVAYPADEPDWMFDGKLLAEHLKTASPAPSPRP